jgi:hypothetical protein
MRQEKEEQQKNVAKVVLNGRKVDFRNPEKNPIPAYRLW